MISCVLAYCQGFPRNHPLLLAIALFLPSCVYDVHYQQPVKFAPFVQIPPANSDTDSRGSMPVWDSIYFQDRKIAPEFTRKIVALRGEVFRVITDNDGWNIYQMRMLSEGKNPIWMRNLITNPSWKPSEGQIIRVLGYWGADYNDDANRFYSSDKFRVKAFCLYNESTDQFMTSAEKRGTCDEWVKGTHAFEIYRKFWE